MSYNGTVYCGWCGHRGHNRAGCQERKQFIKDNPESSAARAEAHKVQRRKNRPRACSYCRAAGHTRRTCSVIKEDRALLAKKLTKSRASMLAMAAHKGFGLGALVNVAIGWNGPEPALVRSINWTFCDEPFFTVNLEWVRDSINRVRSIDIRRLGTPDELGDHKVLSKSASLNAPENWKNGTLYREDEYFPKGESRRSWLFHDV